MYRNISPRASSREGTHEALVDADTFCEVQDGRKRRRDAKNINRKGRNQKREYLLSAGFGHCGRRKGVINGTTKTVKNRKKTKERRYPRYYCSTTQNVSPSACAGYGIPMDALDEFVLGEVKASVTTPACLSALAEGLEAEFARHLEQHKPLGADEAATLKDEQERIEAVRRGLVESIRDNPAAIALMKPGIEKLALEAEVLKRRQRQATPSLDKSKIKEMVEKGIAFYRERVLGPMGGLVPEETTAVEGMAADASGKGPTRRRRARKTARACRSCGKCFGCWA